jgi:hypothetical protein
MGVIRHIDSGDAADDAVLRAHPEGGVRLPSLSGSAASLSGSAASLTVISVVIATEITVTLE